MAVCRTIISGLIVYTRTGYGDAMYANCMSVHVRPSSTWPLAFLVVGIRNPGVYRCADRAVGFERCSGQEESTMWRKAKLETVRHQLARSIRRCKAGFDDQSCSCSATRCFGASQEMKR
jgi:hypothetical protein